MKIGFLGAGAWGVSLASLLSHKGYTVVSWTQKEEFATLLSRTRTHPKLPNYTINRGVVFTSHLREAIEGADFLVEAVTSRGVRPVLEKIGIEGGLLCPIVITSKGIEQNTSLFLPEVAVDVLGKSCQHLIGCLSGPTLAEEVIKQMPTSVVCSAYDPFLMLRIQDIFLTPFFRVYANHDIQGVSLGGAMKNIIAIACGISDGLGFGDNAKAALITRGLHEIQKLASTKGANPQTLTGLAGLGDLCVTSLSKLSRNYTFGNLLGKGVSIEAAKNTVGMVVEGVYTCVSALQLAKKSCIEMPITQAIYSIVYDYVEPTQVVKTLLERVVQGEFE